MALRAPHLYSTLRAFTLGAFVVLGRELEEGADLPFSFEEHVQRTGPALYELRPLVRSFIDERVPLLRSREDARLALTELEREPTARIFAHAHAGVRSSEADALFRTVLLGLLISTAEACGGFDWADEAFERVYAELETSLFGEHRRYRAVAPLVGLEGVNAVELGPSVRVCPAVSGELSAHWPEAGGLLPEGFGREPDRVLVLELVRDLGPGAEPPDAPAEIADAVTAIRLATSAALAAGPVLFETLDGRPYGIRPALPIAATAPLGAASRLDSFRAPIAVELLAALGLADGDPELSEALDRWELSLFQNEPFRGEQLRAALRAALGETWALRGAVLLEEATGGREALHGALASLAEGGEATEDVADAVRRALVAVLRCGDRADLVRGLDRELLGVGRTPLLRAVAS